MCKTLSKYKCGKCYSCYSSKRNSLAIRLTEHYNGIIRHFEKGTYAIFFGMLTFKDEAMPKFKPDSAKPFHWQKPIQDYIKRLNKLFPFLKFEYFIGAEFPPGINGRFHCHPLFFVTLREDFWDNPKYKVPNSNLALRYASCIMNLQCENTAIIKMLKSRTHKERNRADSYKVTYFEKFVFDLLKWQWSENGISNFRPVLNTKAVKYVTKYVMKSRNPNFVQYHVVKYKDSSKCPIPFRSSTYNSDFGKIRTIYKSYLISRGIGNYFYETQQYKDLLNNFRLEFKTEKIPFYFYDGELYEKEITYLSTSPLFWSDPENCGYNSKNQYSLPLKYRQHLYDEIAPKYSENRLFISSAGYTKLDLSFIKFITSQLISLGLNFWVKTANTETQSISPNYHFNNKITLDSSKYFGFPIYPQFDNSVIISQLTYDIPYQVITSRDNWQILEKIADDYYTKVSKFKNQLLFDDE